MENNLLALYGLKHRPFAIGIPVEALWKPSYADTFFHRVENVVLDGGFALISGEVGLGKSKMLQALAHRLKKIGDDVMVGVMERPQNTLSDFYRELGELFGIQLSPNNRYGGFKALRDRWRTQIAASLFRPVLLIDEAQEMSAAVLNELRILSSANFDSDNLLSIVLCGDNRLLERLTTRELLPLGSRIRTRYNMQALDHEMLLDFLNDQLEQAGAPHLMTEELKTTLVQHSGGNLRILCGIASELLASGAERNLKRLDEKLYLEMYGQPVTKKSTVRR